VQTAQAIWFGVLVVVLVAAGIAAQLGWTPGAIPVPKRVLRRDKDTQRDTPRSVGGPP
jgi:hypothetical protein